MLLQPVLVGAVIAYGPPPRHGTPPQGMAHPPRPLGAEEVESSDMHSALPLLVAKGMALCEVQIVADDERHATSSDTCENL